MSPGRVLSRDSGERLVPLHTDSLGDYTLDEVGAPTWELCDGSHSVSDIVGVLHVEYDAPAELIEGDVRELLTELADERLVHEAAAA